MTFSATVLVRDYWQLSGRPSPIRANRLQHQGNLSFDLPAPQAQGPEHGRRVRAVSLSNRSNRRPINVGSGLTGVTKDGGGL